MSLERGLGLGLHGTHDGTAHYEGARAVDSEHGSESRSRAFAQHLGFIIRYKNKKPLVSSHSQFSCSCDIPLVFSSGALSL